MGRAFACRYKYYYYYRRPGLDALFTRLDDYRDKPLSMLALPPRPRIGPWAIEYGQHDALGARFRAPRGARRLSRPFSISRADDDVSYHIQLDLRSSAQRALSFRLSLTHIDDDGLHCPASRRRFLAQSASARQKEHFYHRGRCMRGIVGIAGVDVG